MRGARRAAAVTQAAAPRSCDLYDVSDRLTPYATAWEWQKALQEARLATLTA